MSHEPSRARLVELLKSSSFERRKVILASGRESDFFIDCKQTVLTAEGHALVGELMFDALARLCGERGVALQTIKSIALARWDGREQTANTWYEPLTEQEDIDLAVHWVLGNPQVCLNTVGSVELLPKVLAAASRFESRPADNELERLAATRGLASLFA